MEPHRVPFSPKKGTGNPYPRRGQIRNRIVADFFRSVAAIARGGRRNGGGGGSGNQSSASSPVSSAYNSEGTTDA